MVSRPRIEVPGEPLAAFCRKWKVCELALFGSVLREDFGPESDVDVLVRFSAGARWTLLDETRMEHELAQLFGRSVDLVSRRAVQDSRNWIRREAILTSAEPVYVEG